MGVASLVTGIASLVFSWVPLLGLALGIVGTVCGGKGQKDETQKGLATGGLVCGIIGTVIGAIFTLIGCAGMFFVSRF